MYNVTMSMTSGAFDGKAETTNFEVCDKKEFVKGFVSSSEEKGQTVTVFENGNCTVAVKNYFVGPGEETPVNIVVTVAPKQS